MASQGYATIVSLALEARFGLATQFNRIRHLLVEGARGAYTMITVIDYGMGNVGSVQNMLRRVGAASVLSSCPDEVRKATRLILPGVGSFDAGMHALGERGLIGPIREAVLNRGAAILGICLGMQLLSRGSEEGFTEGLALHKSSTVRIPQLAPDGRQLRVPHMGWNEVVATRKHSLLNGLPTDSRFYFVHSYHVVCDDPADVLLSVNYGHQLTASFAADTVFGVQFHPEKSHKFGMTILKNYAEYVAC